MQRILLAAEKVSTLTSLDIAAYIVFGLIIAAGLFFTVGIIRRWPRPPIEEHHQPSPLGFIDVIVMFVAWLAGQLAAIGAAKVYLGVGLSDLTTPNVDQLTVISFCSAIFQALFTGLAVAYLVYRYRTPAAVGLQRSKLKQNLILGLIAFTVVIPVVLGIQWILTQWYQYEHPTLSLLKDSGTASTILACWLSAVVVAPITEEIFFRGVLQGWMQRINGSSVKGDQVLLGGWDQKQTDEATPNDRVNLRRATEGIAPDKPIDKGHGTSSTTYLPWWPIILSASIFALAHFGQGPAPYPLFVFGLALGYIYRQTGSLAGCIVLHMLLNGFSMFWFTLDVLWG